MFVTGEYTPYGWVIFSINFVAIITYASWKPYHWHMNNEASVLILKDHGITKPNWWNTRKLFSRQIKFLVNERSVVNFYMVDVSIVYWLSVREIYWYELEYNENMIEYLDVIVSDDNFVSIESNQKYFDKAIEIMKNKFPEFSENWDKRRELPDDEDNGVLLYEKYPNW